MIWNSKQLSQALLVDFVSDEGFGKIQFNSQDVEKNDIFIALTQGSRDGHDFVLDAFSKGAGLAIVSKDIKGAPQEKIIKLEDTFIGLLRLAEYKRLNSKAKFIAITGSVGKTSTKEIVSLMLNSFGKTYSSRKNFNNQIGVPIDLASISDDCKYVVIEMGMRGPSQIRYLTDEVTPDIALITSVAECHLEFFDSIESIADAKCEIFEGLDINIGIAILNRDISTYKRCMENIDTVGIENVKTFGESKFANIRLVSYEPNGDVLNLEFNLHGKKLEITVPMVPKHMAINFAAGLAVISALGLDVKRAASNLENFELKIGRGKIVNIKKDNKKYAIITDYYNANPASMKAGLNYLGQIKNDQKVAVIGDMKELGKDEVKIHLKIVPHIVKAGVKKLFLVGDIVKEITKTLPKTIEVHVFKNSDDLAQEINKYIENNDVIFIKASRLVKLEKVAMSLGVTDAL